MGYLQCNDCNISDLWGDALAEWDYAETLSALWNARVLPVVALYLISIPVSRHLFGYGKLYNENKQTCKLIMFVYNMLMTAYSGYTAFHAWRIMLDEFDFGNQLFSNFGSPSCEDMFKNPFLHQLAVWFYYSKYAEFMDTWFLTLRNANVSVLQWFHHGGIVTVMWGFLQFKNEAVFITMAMNAFIHTMMYAYFGLSIFVKKIPGKFLLTLCQLVQFWSGLWSSSSIFNQKCIGKVKNRTWSLVWVHVYTWCLVVLFSNFFIRSYLNPKPKRKKKQS